MDNPADFATGLGLFKAALYLVLFGVLAVTGHGLWRNSQQRRPTKEKLD